MQKLFIAVIVMATVLLGCFKSPISQPDTSALKKYTITTSVGDNGSISPPGTTMVTEQSQVKYDIRADEGYVIATLTIDGVSVPFSNSHTFSYTFDYISANHTLAVTFAYVGTITTIAVNGTVTSTQNIPAATATLTLTPAPGFHSDSLYVNGQFIKSLHGVATFNLTNVVAGETVRVTFSLATSQGQLDSLKTLLIGQWTMVQLNSKLGDLQSSLTQWDVQPFSACSSNQYDQFTVDGVFQRNNNPAACDPLANPQQQQFVPRPLNHWKLKSNGNVIYLTDPPVDSLTLITVTKDSLTAIYFGGFNRIDISYRYHYARKH